MKTAISSKELSCYFFMWISANIYSLIKLYEAQNEILENNIIDRKSLYSLIPGLEIFGQYWDVTDFEWNTWAYFISHSWHYMFLQFLVSESLRRIRPSLVVYWYFLSSAIFILQNFGIIHFTVIIVQPLLYVTLTFCVQKKNAVWAATIVFLIAYNIIKNNNFYFLYENKFSTDEEVYLVLYSMGWVQLRCISFSMDHLDNMEKAKLIEDKLKRRNTFGVTLNDIMKCLSYSFYLPVLHHGPLISFEDFDKSLKAYNTNLSTRLFEFTKNMILYIIYSFLLVAATHLIYFSALQEHVEVIKQMPTVALCGGGLWMGVHFHMKYVIAYGTTGAYASLDNIEAPPTPRCVARVHIYSQMWRYFDVGLYRFLIKYIYKPCLEKMTELNIRLPLSMTKLVATFATFAFIFLWHGFTQAVFVWVLINFIGITCEHFGKIVLKTNLYRKFKENILVTDAMEARVIALICAPLLALSAISNFYLFCDYDVGNEYMQRFTSPTLVTSAIIMASLYANCHVSMALQDVPSRTTRIR